MPKKFKVPEQSLSWHFTHDLKPDDKDVKGTFNTIPAGDEDIQKVISAYSPYNVNGYEIASIEIIYNEPLNRSFGAQLNLLNNRYGNPKYKPTWPNIVNSKEQSFRKKIYEDLLQLTEPHKDLDFPHVKILPCWHGTSEEIASNHIFKEGYGIFSDLKFKTDEGYFGSGIYSAIEADYAFRVYATKYASNAILLMNYVCIYNAYPVIDGDQVKLQGKQGGYDNCDSHWIPVRSNAHPNTAIYLPCKLNEVPQYREIVVFNSLQCLPRYKVKLKRIQIENKLRTEAFDCYQQAIKYLNNYEGQQIKISITLFQEAEKLGHPAACIRLHWINSYTQQPCSKPSNNMLPNFIAAYEWLLHHTLEFNDLEALWCLGWCYANGLGTKQESDKAASQYWLSAKQGYSQAQYSLAECLFIGFGIEQDISLAIKYYHLASSKNHALAKAALNKLSIKGQCGFIIKTILEIIELKFKMLFKEKLTFKLTIADIMNTLQQNLHEILLKNKDFLISLCQFLEKISNHELTETRFIETIVTFSALLEAQSLLSIITVNDDKKLEYSESTYIDDAKDNNLGLMLYLLLELPSKEELKYIPAIIYDKDYNISHFIIKNTDITTYTLQELKKTKHFGSIEPDLKKLIKKHYKKGSVFLEWKEDIINWITSKNFHNLTTEQELNHLMWQIKHGKKNAEKIHKKDLIFFIGNTGSGKSTLINYLHGCTFISAKEIQGKKTKWIVKVDPNSPIKEITTIGHAESSQTLIPEILNSNSKQQLVYCDCPGFSDNRGSKINIINAFNIKHFVTNAKTVKLVIVVDYKTIDANRGQLLNELREMILKFFDNKEEIISKNNLAILVVVSKMPKDQVLDINEIRENLCDDDSIIPWHKENIFAYDPLNTEVCIANGASNKEQLIKKISSMDAIQNHKTIFEVALNTQDFEYLITISTNLENKISEELLEKLKLLDQTAIGQISEYLYLLLELKIFNNEKIFIAYNRSIQSIKNYAIIFAQQIKDLCRENKFEEAENKLFFFKTMQETFDRELCDLEGDYILVKEYLKIQIINNIKNKLAISTQTLSSSFHEHKELQDRICNDIYLLFLKTIPENLTNSDIYVCFSKLAQLNNADSIIAPTLTLNKDLVEMFCIAAKYKIILIDPSEELAEILKVIKSIISRAKLLVIEKKKIRLTDLSIQLSKNILEIIECSYKDKDDLLNYIVSWIPHPENNLLNLNNLLQNLSSINTTDPDVQNIITIFQEAAEIAEFLGNNFICDTNINRIFIDLRDRVVKIIELNRLLNLVKQGIKKHDFLGIRENMISIEKLNTSMLAYVGIEECIQFLCKSFNDGFKWSNFQAASDSFKDLINLEKNLGDLLKQLQHKGIIKCDIEKEIQKTKIVMREELEKLTEEAKIEILNVFSETTLQCEPNKQMGICIKKFENLLCIGKYFNFLDFVETKIKEILKMCKNHIKEIFNKLRLEPNKQKTVIKIANVLVQSRAIVYLINDFELKNELDNDTKNLIKSYEIFISQIGNDLSILAGNSTNINRYASELIEKYPEFIRFKIADYNKKASKSIVDIFKELGIKERSKLRDAYFSYNETYEAVVANAVAAFKYPNNQEQGKQICQSILLSAVDKSIKTSKEFIMQDFPGKYPEKIGNIIGNIFGVWTCLDAQNGGFGSDTQKLLQPHAAQVVSILLLLGINDINEENRINNHLLQIKTGEGKSVTIAITAIILSLLGYRIDIACYSVYLASRDEKNFIKLFKLFKVDPLITYSNFNSLIEISVKKFGNVRELGKQLLKDAIEGGTVNFEHVNKILFIDEVDVFFSEKFLGENIHPCIIINDISFKNLLIYIWKNRKTLLSNKEEAKQGLANHALMREFLCKYPNANILMDLTLDKIFQGLLQVNQGKHIYQKHPEKGIGYKDDTLGIVNYNSFQGYSTTFAYIKEQEIGFFASTANQIVNNDIGLILNTGSLSYMEIPKDYKFILGVTGTLSSLSSFEKEIIKSYGISRTTFIPSIFDKKDLHGTNDIKMCDGDIDAEDNQGYFYNIRDEIIKVYMQDRAILVVFENYDRLVQFKNFIRVHPYEKLQNISPNIIALEETSGNDDKDSYTRSALIESAASSNNVTYLTRIYGRGSDFVCRDSKLTRNGGVHVIQTFFSEYESEEIQIKGRTCRQDDPGSYRMILYLKDLKKFSVEKFADLETFSTENKKSSTNWYDFLSHKRAMYLGNKGSELKKTMQESSEKHQDTMLFISLLESSGPKSSFFNRLPSIDVQNKKEQAKQLLLKFNS